MRLLALAALLLSVVHAAADPIYAIRDMSCAQVQAALRTNGSAVLRWRSKTGATRYDRYVSDRRFCWSGEVASFATVPAADRPCTVRKCVWRLPSRR
jgi:hypothetical protein